MQRAIGHFDRCRVFFVYKRRGETGLSRRRPKIKQPFMESSRNSQKALVYQPTLSVPNQIQASLVCRIIGVKIVLKNDHNGLAILASIIARMPLADDGVYPILCWHISANIPGQVEPIGQVGFDSVEFDSGAFHSGYFPTYSVRNVQLSKQLRFGAVLVWGTSSKLSRQ